MDNQSKVKILKSTALIKVDIGAKFYEQLKALYFWYVELQGADKCIASIKELVKREPNDDTERHLLTIMALLVEIETKADQQGLLEDQIVNPDQIQ